MLTTRSTSPAARRLRTALGVVVGAVPAVHVARINLGSVLRDDNRTGTTGRRAKYVRRGLVVAEVALAFVLLIGAGLLLASFRQLLRIDPGFMAAQVLTGRVAPLEARYPNDAALRSYTDRALGRIRTLPGVAAAGVSSFLPFGWDGSSSVIMPEGHLMTPGESVVSPNQLYVTPGYLEALRVPLVRGRLFTDSDAPPAPAVVIVFWRMFFAALAVAPYIALSPSVRHEFTTLDPRRRVNGGRRCSASTSRSTTARTAARRKWQCGSSRAWRRSLARQS